MDGRIWVCSGCSLCPLCCVYSFDIPHHLHSFHECQLSDVLYQVPLYRCRYQSGHSSCMLGVKYIIRTRNQSQNSVKKMLFILLQKEWASLTYVHIQNIHNVWIGAIVSVQIQGSIPDS